jgi:hypothetical protein
MDRRGRASELFERFQSGCEATIDQFIAEEVSEELFLDYKRAVGPPSTASRFRSMGTTCPAASNKQLKVQVQAPSRQSPGRDMGVSRPGTSTALAQAPSQAPGNSLDKLLRVGWAQDQRRGFQRSRYRAKPGRPPA